MASRRSCRIPSRRSTEAVGIAKRIRLYLGDAAYDVEIRADGPTPRLSFGGSANREARIFRIGSSALYTLVLDNSVHRVQFAVTPNGYELTVDGERRAVSTVSSARRRQENSLLERAQVVRAGISGVIGHTFVQVNERVEAGALLLEVEAMKMSNEIRAQWGGVVRRIWVTEGQRVAAGDPLIEIDG